MGLLHLLATPRLRDHVRQSETRQVLAHVVADVSPHPKQDALAFVVAGTVLMGLSKVAGDNGAVDCGDYFIEGNYIG